MITRRPRLVAIALLSLALVAGMTLGLLPAGHSAMALDHNDENDCTGTLSDPAELGPYSGSSSSAGIRWTATPCITCTVTTDPPERHVTEIELTGSASCPSDWLVGSIWVTFCESMSSTTAGTQIGWVTFYTPKGTVVRKLEFFNSTTGYAVAPCYGGQFLKAAPYKVKVDWGENFGGVNPSKGNALAGFDIFAQCCDL